MRFLPKRFLEEFFLYSSQFVVFFLIMLFSTPLIASFQPEALIVLTGCLLLQISLLAKFGHMPVPRFVFSFITPLGYTFLQALTRRIMPIDMANFFLWATAVYVGLFQALGILTRRIWPKRFFETMLALDTVFTFVFFYFYLDLRIAANAKLEAGVITYKSYLDIISIDNAIPAFSAFMLPPQHTFFLFGALTFGIIQWVNKVKELSLQTRLNRVIESLPPPEPSVAEATRLARGDNKDVVIVYADIWNFTPMADKLSGESTMEVLNQYYGMWSLVVRRHRGYVDQFVGDTAIAVFGIMGEKEAYENAVACALEFLKELPHLQADLASKTLPPIKHIGIGVHAGASAVGELGIGDQKRIAVIGDAVNTAARLDSLCREFKQDILISHTVYKNLSIETQSEFQKLGEVLLRGKTQPSPVYGRK